MEGKGWGVLADEDIMPRAFVMEYIGAIFLVCCGHSLFALALGLAPSSGFHEKWRFHKRVKMEWCLCRRDCGCGGS